jgi:MoxR-like ATPase
MANEDKLRNLLTNIADNSDGQLSFNVTTASQLSKEIGVKLARSPNPIYVFKFKSKFGKLVTVVAFTLTLDGSGRPATRAEALGNSLHLSQGELFEYNPILLVYDYVGERLLAVPAINLFAAFTEYASKNTVPYSDSAFFSLSPNFQNGTISMYAEVRAPEVWSVSATGAGLTQESLISFLLNAVNVGETHKPSVPAIIAAVTARINASASTAKISTSSSDATSLESTSETSSSGDVFDDAVQIDDRLWKMIVNAINSSPATILVGPPGTGKSALVRKAVQTINLNWQRTGRESVKAPLWATPDESWTARDLIGGETVVAGELTFRPGWVLRSIEEGRWLILDEANRGDLDRIFGALLTWLSGGTVTVGMESNDSNARRVELGWTLGKSRVEVTSESQSGGGVVRYLAGEDWRIIGTYNALDSQRVFRLGAALGRRFLRIPIPPVTPYLFEIALASREPTLPKKIRDRIALLYSAHFIDDVTRLGPAQFLGMCQYIKSSIDNVTLTNYGHSEPLASTDHLGENFTLSDSESSTNNIDARVIMKPEIISALCEAYVLNVGVQLAQLEEPDFDRLSERLLTNDLFSENDIAWLRDMIKALA